MATFSAPSFSADSYASFRPTYPPTLFSEHLLPFHRGARDTLVDLGCGPGTVIRPLSAFFTRAIGADPSCTMLKTARSLTPADEFPNITYRTSPAESLPFLADGEVDMVVAGQAAHWFDYGAWWPEMARVVRPGGSVAVWGYRDFMFPAHPKASRVIREWTEVDGPMRLGPCWSRPGRDIVESRYRAIRPPETEWEDIERWEYEPDFTVEVSEEDALQVRRPVLPDDGLPGFGKLVGEGEGMLKKKMKIVEVMQYVRTLSAAHVWRETNGKKSKSEGGEGDAVDWCFEEIASVEGWGEGWEERVVELEWGHGMVMARRREA